MKKLLLLFSLLLATNASAETNYTGLECGQDKPLWLDIYMHNSDSANVFFSSWEEPTNLKAMSLVTISPSEITFVNSGNFQVYTIDRVTLKLKEKKTPMPHYGSDKNDSDKIFDCKIFTSEELAKRKENYTGSLASKRKF